jgi:arsenate reductase-like glutaredoxin family protein
LQDAVPNIEFRMYDKVKFTDAELSRIMGDRPVSDFLNARSTPFKELGLEGKSVSKTKFIKLMRTYPNLLRRPMVIQGTSIIFGTDEAAYRKL